MFRARPDGRPATVAVAVEEQAVLVPEGASAAAAILLAGLADGSRDSAIGGAARGPYCLMGVCFDCLAEIDGVANRRSCMVTAQPGMQIRRQRGARRLAVSGIASSLRSSQ